MASALAALNVSPAAALSSATPRIAAQNPRASSAGWARIFQPRLTRFSTTARSPSACSRANVSRTRGASSGRRRTSSAASTNVSSAGEASAVWTIART